MLKEKLQHLLMCHSPTDRRFPEVKVHTLQTDLVAPLFYGQMMFRMMNIIIVVFNLVESDLLVAVQKYRAVGVLKKPP